MFSMMDSIPAVKSHTYIVNIQLHGTNLKITALKIPSGQTLHVKANLCNEALLLKTVID